MNNSPAPAIKRINCPTCQKIVEWKEENVFRPFCSQKCQLIDFGDWANEKNAIPVANGPEDFRVDGLDVNDGDQEGF